MSGWWGGVEEAAWALLRVTLSAELRVAGCSQVCRGGQGQLRADGAIQG